MKIYCLSFLFLFSNLIAFEQEQKEIGELALPTKPQFIIDTDSLNDPDDVLAHIYSIKEFGESIGLVTTNLYDPKTKAKGVKLLFKLLGYPKIPVSSGYGVDAGDEESFLKVYPCWPTKFGIPGKTNKVSLLQAKAYRKYFSDFDTMTISEGTAVKDIISVSKTCDKNLVVIAQAPLTNLALAFDSMQNIDRIVMMGGWLEDEHGSISRLGYNTAVDLKSSQKILEQDKVPVIIISSELVKKNKFVISDKEREVLLGSSCKTLLGQAVCDDMHAYWENKVPPKGELAIADMLTAYVAKHPESISKTQCVKLKFDERLLDIDMFHPSSKDVIKVKKVEKSNVYIVTELVNSTKIRMQLVLSLFSLFYPGVEEKLIQELLESDSDAKSIVVQLNKLSKI